MNFSLYSKYNHGQFNIIIVFIIFFFPGQPHHHYLSFHPSYFTWEKEDFFLTEV